MNEISLIKFEWNSSILFIYKTALHVAIERGNPEIVKLILSQPEIDVNTKCIYKFNLFYVIFIWLFQLYFEIFFLTKFCIISYYKVLNMIF